MMPEHFDIIVVEDERIISLALTVVLRNLGHRVIACVSSGEDALKALETERPDLVLMDIHLDGSLNGIETAHIIRNQNGPPVAFTTAYTDAETRTKAEATSPLGFLGKPVGRREIMGLLSQLSQS